jgi:hypothetical protein
MNMPNVNESISLVELRGRLVEDHDRLRELIVAVRMAGAEVLDDRARVEPLVAAVEKLHRAFVEHNRVEEWFLVPILKKIDAWGPQRLEQMIVEHHREHAAMITAFTTGPAPDAHTLARDMLALVDHLTAHMDEEERTFLSRDLLRDDCISLGATS